MLSHECKIRGLSREKQYVIRSASAGWSSAAFRTTDRRQGGGLPRPCRPCGRITTYRCLRDPKSCLPCSTNMFQVLEEPSSELEIG